MLLGYPVTICTADQLKIQRGRFFISNTDTSQGPGEHWVAFNFPKRGPFEFFDSLGHMAKDYGVEFEKIPQKRWSTTVIYIQCVRSILHILCYEETSGKNDERHCKRLKCTTEEAK